jgi:hypothetical protein
MRLIIILIVFATINSFTGNEGQPPKLEATKARLPQFVGKTARPREKVLFLSIYRQQQRIFLPRKVTTTLLF